MYFSVLGASFSMAPCMSICMMMMMMKSIHLVPRSRQLDVHLNNNSLPFNTLLIITPIRIPRNRSVCRYFRPPSCRVRLRIADYFVPFHCPPNHVFSNFVGIRLTPAHLFETLFHSYQPQHVRTHSVPLRTSAIRSPSHAQHAYVTDTSGYR